ncbi:hypothetical protein AVEN_125055-1 [Araneus ventricosus]|uniref:Uncharacterized protein n=1 Tax=Araneus ventricosus TaxID=182803 RepID=A0A4Y2GTQ7_ARAVE|nr:hypothetical protein AVEN_125055-1 [Araneus ventricosus]
MFSGVCSRTGFLACAKLTKNKSRISHRKNSISCLKQQTKLPSGDGLEKLPIQFGQEEKKWHPPRKAAIFFFLSFINIRVAAFLSTRYFHDEESVLEIMAQTPCILPVSRHHLRTDATWIGINVRVCSISFVILHIFRATADDKLGLSNNLIYPK